MTYGVLTEDPAGLSMDRGDSLTLTLCGGPGTM